MGAILLYFYRFAKKSPFSEKAAGKVKVFWKGHKNLKKSLTCFVITE